MDKVRHRTLAAAGQHPGRHARWALVKNPADLSQGQRAGLNRIKATNDDLYTGYLLTEQPRAVFAAKGHHGRELLGG